MNNHEFTVVLFEAKLNDEVMNALFEAGCDDATVSSRNGNVILTFSRKARSRTEAIVSACRDVRKVTAVLVANGWTNNALMSGEPCNPT